MTCTYRHLYWHVYKVLIRRYSKLQPITLKFDFRLYYSLLLLAWLRARDVASHAYTTIAMRDIMPQTATMPHTYRM